MGQSQAGAATYVSTPGGQVAVGLSVPGSPGSGAPGATMSMTSAAVWVIGGAAAFSFLVGFLARKGVKPEIGRFDVVQVAFTATGTIVVIATLKTVAYATHGHKLSQAFLMLV